MDALLDRAIDTNFFVGNENGMLPSGLKHIKKDATVLSTEDFGMGNYDSGDDVDGKEPDIWTKRKVNSYVNAAEKIQGKDSLPEDIIPRSASSYKKTTIGSITTVIEQQMQLLEGKKQWSDAATTFSNALFAEFKCADYDHGLSFLVLGAGCKLGCS